MKSTSPKSYGFTLLEVIISLTILTIVIAGIYGMNLNSIKNNKFGEIKQKEEFYGEKIFEDFKSNDIIKTLTKEGTGYALTFSNGLKLTGDSSYKVTDYDLGNGYKADIEVNRNTSTIGSGQTLQGTTSDYSFLVNFKKNSLQSALMSDETKNDDWNQTSVNASKPTEIDVTIDSDSNGKTITVKIADGKSFSKPFTFNKDQQATDKKKEIRLSINCSEYNLDQDAKTNDQGFEVHVFNHDIVPLNLCLQKTNTIKGTAVSEAGMYRLFNNRSSSNAISQGNLYDIKIKVKKTDYANDEDVFTGEISQNLSLIDKTNP